MKIYPIIDTGHGYNTPGKRSEGFYYPNGKVMLKENSVNEAVGNKLSFALYEKSIAHTFITNELYDVNLSERVRREHYIYSKIDKTKNKPLLISIHADAFHIKNKANGGRFYYKSNKGKEFAEYFTKYLREHGYMLNLRRPKQANFMMLRETNSTAILFEMGFMTTESDLEILLSDDFRNKTAELLKDAIINYD